MVQIMPGLHHIGGHVSSLHIPRVYCIRGNDHIKMVEDPGIKYETAGRAEGRTTLLPMRYTYITFFDNSNATVSFRTSLNLSSDFNSKVA